MSDIASNQTTARGDAGHGISFGEAFRVWLRVALLSFGGPAGQIAVILPLRLLSAGPDASLGRSSGLDG